MVNLIDTGIQARLERAERALTAAGFTQLSPANEWKPPLGPSASPLLDRIDQMQAEIDTLALTWDYIERLVKVLSWLGYNTPESKEEQAAKQNMLVFNLIRAVEESKDLLTTTAAPDGWQIVPLELTSEMREAFYYSYECFEEGMGTCPDSQWKAMLRKAPKLQGGAS